jgi:hypothetical protein
VAAVCRSSASEAIWPGGVRKVLARASSAGERVVRNDHRRRWNRSGKGTLVTAAKRTPREKLVLGLVFGTAVVLSLAIVTPNFIRCRCQSSLTACKSNLKNFGTALEMYSTDHGRYPRRLAELTPDYLKTLPKCPSGKSYGADIGAGNYHVFCAGGWHGKGSAYGTHSAASHREVMTARRSPAYGSVEGLLPDKILFTLDGFNRKSEAYVAACRNVVAATVGILVLLGILGALRRHRVRAQTSKLQRGVLV